MSTSCTCEPNPAFESQRVREEPSSNAIHVHPVSPKGLIKAAIDEAVPAPVLSTALYERFGSRGDATFADKLLSVVRFEFGGHPEKGHG